MNRRQHQRSQHHHQSSNGSFGSAQSHSQNRSGRISLEYLRKERLHREMLLEQVHARIDELGQRGALLQAEQQAHMRSMPLGIAQVALSALGVRALPPIARQWYARQERLQEAEQHLRHEAVRLHAQLQALTQEIQLLDLEIDMQKYY